MRTLKREEQSAMGSVALHDLMQGAVWRDPDQVEEWIGDRSPDQPIAVYCAYGFHVGCNVAKTLRDRGFDARYIRRRSLRLVRRRWAASDAAVFRLEPSFAVARLIQVGYGKAPNVAIGLGAGDALPRRRQTISCSL